MAGNEGKGVLERIADSLELIANSIDNIDERYSGGAEDGAHEASPEAARRLDELRALRAEAGGRGAPKAAPKTAPKAASKTAAKGVAKGVAKPKPAPAPAKSEESVSHDDVRQAMREWRKNGGTKEQAVEILEKHSVKSISSASEESLPGLLADFSS